MPKQTEISERTHEELSPQEKSLIEKVSRITLSLDKTTKSKKFYLPNNPILLKHQNDLFALFKDFFTTEKELNLKITNTSFQFMNFAVYQNSVKSENFAFKLHSDGIRSITFYEGLSIEELLEFMDILNKGMYPAKEDSEEDLVTLLWDKQFDNIKYVVVENIIEDSMVSDGKSTEDRIDDVISESKTSYFGLGEEYKDIIEIEEIPITFDATNFGEMFKTKGVLSKEEVDKIHQEVELGDRKENILADFMDILPFILDEDIREEEMKRALHIIGSIVDSCIFNGNLEATFLVLARLKKFPEIIKTDPGKIKEPIDRFINSLSRKEKIEEFVNCINLNFTGLPEEITKYISQLSETAVPALLKVFSNVTDPHYRKSIAAGIAVIFKGDPGIFLNYISAKDPETLKDMLYLLSLIKNEKVIDLIPYFISNQDKTIKKDCINLLKNFRTNPKTVRILLGALEDPDIEIRTLTLRTLATSESRETAKQLLAMIQEDDFPDKDLMEKKSYFFAVAKLYHNDFIPYLSDILDSRGIFSKEKLDELYQCACFALGMIGSDKAKEVLEKATASKNKSIQKYSRSILKKIEMGA